MRHGKKNNHLSRTHSHRVAMLENMASSLILHKRVETTVAKAKELRKFVEPILTRAKEDTYQNRRITFMSLNDKETMKELFGIVADKIADRPGGYTRIIKLGNRQGDNADTCLIELVDFNEVLLSAAAEKATATTKTRRSRRGGGSRQTAEGSAPVAPAVVAETVPAGQGQAEPAPGDGKGTTVTEEPGLSVVSPVTELTKEDQTDQAPSVFGEPADDETKQS